MRRIVNVMSIAAFVALAGLVVVGCKQSKDSPEKGSPKGSPTTSGSLPETLFLKQAPDGAVSLAQAVRDGKDEQEVVVRGVVGGRNKPFVSGRAAMTIADPSLPTCADKGEDHCPTPWDYCCEQAGVLAANSALVQVIGADGKVLASSLENAGGLKPLTKVIVKGVLRRSPDGKAVAINAAGIFVQQ